MARIQELWSKSIDSLASMKLSMTVLVLIAVITARATFIENDYGNYGAKAAVYGTLWFEALLLLTGLNLTARIWKNKLWRKDKFTIFLFHVSIIIMIIGAGMTRYFGYEGMMHIREGSTATTIQSSDTYLTARIIDENGMIHVDEGWGILLSPRGRNRFTKSFDWQDDPVRVVSKQFYLNSSDGYADVAGGTPFIAFQASGTMGGNPEEFGLSQGETLNFNNNRLRFLPAWIEEDESGAALVWRFHNDQMEIASPIPLAYMEMESGDMHHLAAGRFHPFERGRLYMSETIAVTPRYISASAERRVLPSETRTGISALIVDVEYRGQSKEVALQGSSGMPGIVERISLGDAILELSYGAREISLPFGIKLDEFVLARYPGSSSPASYESLVYIIDDELPEPKFYHIYMNNILIHRGFRFYQSSYDQDEKGTVLSVAKDPGKWPTYFGYTLMCIGFFTTFFNRKSRFLQLGRQVSKGIATTLLVAPFLAISYLATQPLAAQPYEAEVEVEVEGGLAPHMPEATRAAGPLRRTPRVIDADHADRFARLAVQDVQGRIKPTDTLGMEFMNKVARTMSLHDQNYNQILLGMMSDPEVWQGVPLVRVHDPEIREWLGLSSGHRYASYNDFFGRSPQGDGVYKIGRQVEEAMQRRPSERSKLDNQLIKVDEQANIVFMALRGDLLRVFPISGHENDQWVAIGDKVKSPEDIHEGNEVAMLYLNYMRALQNQDWAIADQQLEAIKEHQYRQTTLVPSDAQINFEIWFNRLQIFQRLMPYYLFAGLALVACGFFMILFPERKLRWAVWVPLAVLVLGFIYQTFGLGLRWYVSGHAPWSNGYESLIYVVWATVLAGFFFVRHSVLAAGATGVLGGIGLWVAHLSWMDPQITTLVPVLNSYWLTIHVSVITASYGFFALGGILGLLALILFILRNPQKRERIEYAIPQLGRINEMSLAIGLALLSIGNIFGAVWANESWGRYWSWDPKETWTLITMIVYAVVLHFRFIPGLKGQYLFASASLWSYFSVLMTYFGVNYYLSGMHSYAGGDPLPFPFFMWYVIAFFAVIMAVAYFRSDLRMPLLKEKSSGGS